MTTYLDVQQFETYVAACAGSSGVNVQWDKPDATPRTDGKSIWLPAITTATTEEWLIRMRYFVKHETSHVVHSDFDYLNKMRPVGILALINNLIEDHRIDYRNDKEYEGDKTVSSNFWRIYAEDIKTRVAGTDKELQEQQLLVLPLFAWDASLRDWIYSSYNAFHLMQSQLDSDGKTRFAKLAKYSDELRAIRESGTPEQVFDLSKRILKDLYDEDPAKYVEKESEGKGKKGKKGKGDAEAGGGEGAGTDDVDRLITVEKLEKAIGHTHTPSRTGIHLVPTEKPRGSYTIPNPNEYLVMDFVKPLPAEVMEDISSYDMFSTHSVNSYITSNAKPMANKLRIKLQTRSRDRYEYGKKRGKLHNGSLHRVLQKDSPFASKVFRTRVVNDTLDTAVCLLVDCSGSMSGTKFEMACAGAGALSEAMKPLNIAYSIYGFTNTYTKENPMVWLFNEFGQKLTQSELVDRFKQASRALWHNSDGDAVAYATYRLMQRDEHRKVLIVLSDGSPAGRDWAGDITSYTKQTVEHAEKLGIDVYGIGIRDTNVTNFYKKNVVVNSLDNLSPTILSIIDRSL